MLDVKQFNEMNFKILNKDYIEYLTGLIFSFLDEKYHKSLRRNLKSLKFKYEPLLLSEIPAYNNNEFLSAGGYFIQENTIEIYGNGILGYYSMSKNEVNPDKYYYDKLKTVLIHELFHVASTNYDYKDKELKVGFSTSPSKETGDVNQGLTEAITELLTLELLEITIPEDYFFELYLAKQLMVLVSRDIILDSFFNNEGIIEIKRELMKYGVDDNRVEHIFFLFEENYYLINFDENEHKRNILLSSLQFEFINILHKKLINSSLPKEEILYKLNEFEDILVTPELATALGYSNNELVGLDKNINHFNSVKRSILTNVKINENKNSLTI